MHGRKQNAKVRGRVRLSEELIVKGWGEKRDREGEKDRKTMQ
jgi:hypothetical protein